MENEYQRQLDVLTKLNELSQECVDTHTEDDIIEHLEEELIELLLAIKRVRRGREPVINMFEELIDVGIEINTVLTMIGKLPKEIEMMEQKLEKFEKAMEKDQRYDIIRMKGIDRYKSIDFNTL